MAYYDDPTLQNAQMEAQTAGSAAVAYQSAASQLPAKLKEAVMGKLDYNKDLIEQKNKAQAEYFAAPSAAREQYQDIWNPFEREKLVAGERAQAYQPYANLTDILGQRLGNVGDVINQGVGAFNSDVAAKQGAYQLAQQKYADLLQMAQLKQQQANIEEAARTSKTQQEFENAMRLAEFNKPSGGGYGLAGANQSTALASLKSQVESGANFSDLYPRFINELPAYMIRDIYNAGPTAEKYGPAKESDLEMMSTYATGKKATSGNEDTELQAQLKSSLEGIRDWGSNNMSKVLNPTSPEGQRFQSYTTMVTQYLSRAVEKNKISWSEMETYLKAIQPNVIDFIAPDRYRGRIQGVIDAINVKIGEPGSFAPSLDASSALTPGFIPD